MSKRKAICMRCGKVAPLIHECLESERYRVARQIGLLNTILLCLGLLIITVLVGLVLQ